MSVAVESNSSNEQGFETRPVFGPAENRITDKQKQGLKKVQQTRRLSKPVVQRNSSVESFSSSDSSTSIPKKKKATNLLRNGAKVVPYGMKVPSPAPTPSVDLKRCNWITPNSDPLYSSFHDEEWGVPVHDDCKLFELLVLSEALAELSWPVILKERNTFRKLFYNFDSAIVAEFTEKNIIALKANGKVLLSEPKLHAVMENAKQILKIQKEFGSFNNYCWRFVNHKPIRNGYRYVRQIPVKTPKAEAISKDLMRRGFRCVGPTVVYSFMQIAGIVNDHLITCFRYQACNSSVKDITSLLPA